MAVQILCFKKVCYLKPNSSGPTWYIITKYPKWFYFLMQLMFELFQQFSNVRQVVYIK